MPTIVGTREIGSIAGASRSSDANALKTIWADRNEYWIHNETGELTKMLFRKVGQMGGVSRVGCLVTDLAQSAGMSSGERYFLPAPSTSAYVNPRLIARDLYSRTRQTGQVVRAARMGKQAAWLKQPKQQVKDARQQFMINMVRKGILGYYDCKDIVESFSTPIIQLYDRNSRTSGVTTATNAYKHGGWYLRANEDIGWIDTTDGVNGAPYGDGSTQVSWNTSDNIVRIDSVDLSDLANPAVTLETAATVSGGSTLATIVALVSTGYTPAVGDIIVPYASRQNDDSGNDGEYTAGTDIDGFFFTMNGLDSFIRGTQFYSHVLGLSKTTYTKASGLRSTNTESQRAWEEALATLMIHRTMTEGDNNAPDKMLCEYSQIREVVKEHSDFRRFGPMQETKTGYEATLQFTAGDHTVSWIAHWQCPPGSVFGVHSESLEYFEESPYGPLENDGSRFVPDYDQSEDIYHKSGNVNCVRPFANFLIEDLTFNTRAITA